MTRNSCLCRKISKGWVSVQGLDVLMSRNEGQYYLEWDQGSPRPWCPGKGSLHQASRHKGRTVMVPASLSKWRTNPTRAATLEYAQEWGWEFCMWHKSAQSLQVEKKAEDRPLALMYLKLLGWPKSSLTRANFLASPIFLRLETLLISWPFLHHCLKVCTVYSLSLALTRQSCSENETERAIMEGFRGRLLGEKRKFYSTTN